LQGAELDPLSALPPSLLLAPNVIPEQDANSTRRSPRHSPPLPRRYCALAGICVATAATAPNI